MAAGDNYPIKSFFEAHLARIESRRLRYSWQPFIGGLHTTGWFKITSLLSPGFKLNHFWMNLQWLKAPNCQLETTQEPKSFYYELTTLKSGVVYFPLIEL